jgi:hypothetical protein
MKLVQTFHRGGWKETIGVPSGPEAVVDFDAELREVLKENGPVRDEFRRLLTALAYGGRDEKEKIEVNDYWQLMEVDKTPTVALGCGVARTGIGGRWEVADMNYYVSAAILARSVFMGFGRIRTDARSFVEWTSCKQIQHSWRRQLPGWWLRGCLWARFGELAKRSRDRSIPSLRLLFEFSLGFYK